MTFISSAPRASALRKLFVCSFCFCEFRSCYFVFANIVDVLLFYDISVVMSLLRI